MAEMVMQLTGFKIFQNLFFEEISCECDHMLCLFFFIFFYPLEIVHLMWNSHGYLIIKRRRGVGI